MRCDWKSHPSRSIYFLPFRVAPFPVRFSFRLFLPSIYFFSFDSLLIRFRSTLITLPDSFSGLVFEGLASSRTGKGTTLRLRSGQALQSCRDSAERLRLQPLGAKESEWERLR